MAKFYYEQKGVITRKLGVYNKSPSCTSKGSKVMIKFSLKFLEMFL